MDAHCLAIVRYSILSMAQGQGWQTASDNTDKYRRELFNTDRLYLHENLFADVALRSLLTQSIPPDATWFTLLVITSTELPEANKAFLRDLSATYEWVVIREVPPDNVRLGAVILESLQERVTTPMYCTIRLDDDDALASDYFSRLSAYLRPEFDGFGVSFAAGYAGLHDGTRFTEFKHYYQPNLALGLASIHATPYLNKREARSRQIFQLGNHMLLDRRVPVILDSREPAYIRTVHKQSDNFSRTRKRIASLDNAEADAVAKQFPWILDENTRGGL